MNEMTRFIENTHLFLRGVQLSDVNANYCSWLNDPQITRFLEVRHFPVSPEEILRFVSSMDGNYDYLFLAICQKPDGKHIGNIKLGPINQIHRFAEMSILIGDKTAWKKGFASESIKLLAKFAFDTLNLNRLSAGLYEGNTGSFKAFEKAGFKQEGVFRKMRFYKGRYVDQIMMGLLREDFEK
ncbi:MAG: GNAT family protein [Desulfobacula sp.]|jgi:ribosomal-protein-alanine N-acetyltransferase|nr:GNAT family protein [Desulfobacula sp.]